MALGPLRASAPIPLTADFPAIVASLGNNAKNVRYDNGILYVEGVDQAQLDAAAATADASHGARALKKQQAQQQLGARIAAGMMWQSKPLQIDEGSQGRMTAMTVKAQNGTLPNPFGWRMADNSLLVMDAAGMIAMAEAASDYVLALRVRYWQIVDAVNAAPDTEAVEAIDPTAGWPAPPA